MVGENEGSVVGSEEAEVNITGDLKEVAIQSPPCPECVGSAWQPY